MDFILGTLTGIIIATIICLVWPKKRIETVANEDEAKKKENLAKILDYISDKEKFTNDDLQNMLGVSNATVGRYLQELESAGKIKQVGDTGKFVYYTKS
jgi:predicted HTH transcriptional regulator